MSFKITRKVNILCFVIGLSIVYILRDTVNNSLFNLLFYDYGITGNTALDLIVVIIFLMSLLTLVHELLHAAAYKLLGRKVIVGFKGIYACTRDVTGLPLHRTKFVIVLLTPVTVISLITLLFSNWISDALLILNIFKSTRDMLMALYLCLSNKDCYIIEKSNGFDVIQKDYSGEESNIAA